MGATRILLGIFFLLLSAASYADDRVVITINKHSVTQEGIKSFAKYQSLVNPDVNKDYFSIENKSFLNQICLYYAQLDQLEKYKISPSNEELQSMQKWFNDNMHDLSDDEKVRFFKYFTGEQMISKMQGMLISRNIHVTDQEVKELLKSPLGSELSGVEYKIRHMIIDNNIETYKEIVKLLQSGSQLGELAKKYSIVESASNMGLLGWKKIPEIPTIYLSSIKKMQVGEIKYPIKDIDTIHFLQLEDRKVDFDQVDFNKLKEMIWQKKYKAELDRYLLEVKNKLSVIKIHD